MENKLPPLQKKKNVEKINPPKMLNFKNVKKERFLKVQIFMISNQKQFGASNYFVGDD